MNKVLSLSNLTTLAATLCLCLAGSQAMAKDWRGWNIHPPTYPNSIALENFVSLAAQLTDGEVTGEVYHNATLGNQADAISQMQLGSIDFANFNLGPLGTTVPAANVVSLPFIFKDIDHMHRVMDGEFGDKLSAAMAEEGIISLAWYDSGARSFYNSERAINTPSDVEGLKFRVMNNELFVGMVEALGGNASPMAFSEVYQSLKTGVVDGAENNWPSYESTNHYEVAQFYSDTGHLILPECVCVSKQVWDGLSAVNQESLQIAARASADLQRRLWAQRAAASRQAVLDAGIQFNTIADKAAFQNAMAPVYAAAIEETPVLEELINDIQSVE